MADVKWIKFVVGTFDGDSFKKIKRAKTKDGASYRDKLTAVWFELLDLAGKRNNDGILVNVEELELGFSSEAQFEDIATMIDRPVEEVECCIAWFVDKHMIEIIDDLYSLSNWAKYQSIKSLDDVREQARLRQQKHRQLGMSRDSNVTSNVTVTSCNAPRNKNKNKEKELEEENNTYMGNAESQQSPVVIQLPLNDKTLFDVTEKDIEEYQKIFTAIDVNYQFKRMLLWLNDNPKNRKTRVGIKKFISSWLGKEQDRAPKNKNEKEFNSQCKHEPVFDELK